MVFKIFEKRIDKTPIVIHCAACRIKLSSVGYPPKKEWNIDGKLCSKCYGVMLGRPFNPSVKPEKSAEPVENKTNTSETFQNNEKIKSSGHDLDNDDPLTILKRRLARGEITKEEYEDLKKILE